MAETQKRLDSAKFKEIIANANDPSIPVNASLFNMETSRSLIEESIIQFENKGAIYRPALENSKTLLSNPFLNF